MKIIKRNGSEMEFDIRKIENAISKANMSVEEASRMTPLQIRRISESVALDCENMGRSPSVEEIQDLVEKQIMAHGAFEVAKNYITYRYTRSLVRQSNTTDEKIRFSGEIFILVQDFKGAKEIIRAVLRKCRLIGSGVN